MDRKNFALRAPEDLGLRPPGSADPFSNAHPRHPGWGVATQRHVYRAPLPAELEARLRVDERLPPQTLLALLHDFMGMPGLGEGTWPAEAPLKQYLGFSTEQDLDEEEWFVVAMPDELELRHTLALYQLMRSRAD